MKRFDIILSLVIGAITGCFFYFLTMDSGIDFFSRIKHLFWILVVSFSVLSPLGLWICFLIGKKFLWVFQAGKFFLLGVMATLTDIIVFKFFLNLFFDFAVFNLKTEWLRNISKGISFLIVTFVKYWGNKFWTFGKTERNEMKKEITQFFIITAIGLAINVTVFSFGANTIGPQFEIPVKVWESVWVIIAAFASFSWNFLGSKFIVFKK